MKLRIIILSTIVALLCIVFVLQGFGLAQSTVADPPEVYIVGESTASGKGYNLTSLAWQVGGISSNVGYSLLVPMEVTLRGSGCCCTYLPSVLCSYRK